MRPVVLASLMLVACGGASAKYQVDDVALAQISVEDKKPVFQAEHEVSLAKAEQAKALADAKDTDGQLDIADKEQEQAKLETQKVKMTGDQAEKSHDMNRVSSAQRELHIAEVGERAASAKSDWLGKKKKWEKQVASAAEAHIDVALSKVELEKARLAVAKGIKPSNDFKLDDFAGDYAKKVKAWEEEKRDADKMQAQVEKLSQTYNDLKAQYGQLRAPAAPPATSNMQAPSSPMGEAPGAAPPAGTK